MGRKSKTEIEKAKAKAEWQKVKAEWQKVKAEWQKVKAESIVKESVLENSINPKQKID
jgi:hypothetical protein